MSHKEDRHKKAQKAHNRKGKRETLFGAVNHEFIFVIFVPFCANY
jgi:hypothetical protein